MGTIISPTVAEVSFVEAEYEIRDTIFSEAQGDIATERTAGLTPLGYDNEIGLWEELESRDKRKEPLIQHVIYG